MRREPGDEGALQATLNAARAEREREARPAVFKVKTQSAKRTTPTKPRKPTIKQDIAAWRAQIDAQQAATPRAAAQTKHNTKGANSHDDF